MVSAKSIRAVIARCDSTSIHVFAYKLIHATLHPWVIFFADANDMCLNVVVGDFIIMVYDDSHKLLYSE